MSEPHISYYGMGPWPMYLGFTTSPKAFKREMKRLAVEDHSPFVANDHSNATTHHLMHGGMLTCIITLRGHKAFNVEQVAALIAHEATHVAQQLWESIGEREPGREAEAYLVQMITQCCLQDALGTGRERKERP